VYAILSKNTVITSIAPTLDHLSSILFWLPPMNHWKNNFVSTFNNPKLCHTCSPYKRRCYNQL
jgi:hypothetical protein